MRCPHCDGMGDMCDACHGPMVAYQECKVCGGDFCSIAEGAATRVSDGATVDIGNCDHFTGHTCRPDGA